MTSLKKQLLTAAPAAQPVLYKLRDEKKGTHYFILVVSNSPVVIRFVSALLFYHEREAETGM